jgi:hypothetical protein
LYIPSTRIYDLNGGRKAAEVSTSAIVVRQRIRRFETDIEKLYLKNSEEFKKNVIQILYI